MRLTLGRLPSTVCETCQFDKAPRRKVGDGLGARAQACMMGRKNLKSAPDQAGTASSASMSSSSSPSMPPPRGLASYPSQSNCASPGAVIAGAAGGAGVHGPRPECSRTEEDSSLGAAIPSSSSEPLPPGWARGNVTTGLQQYSDGVDKAYTVKAAWELYHARLVGGGPNVPDIFADLVKDWEARMQVTKNPGDASSSTTPAATPLSQPTRAAHQGRVGKAPAMSSLGRHDGSSAFRRPAAPSAVPPGGIQEHSASKTPYRKSKSAWSIHLITNLQVNVDVPLDSVEPLSTPMHDLEVAEVEHEAMVHNREKEVILVVGLASVPSP